MYLWKQTKFRHVLLSFWMPLRTTDQPKIICRPGCLKWTFLQLPRLVLCYGKYMYCVPSSFFLFLFFFFLFFKLSGQKLVEATNYCLEGRWFTPQWSLNFSNILFKRILVAVNLKTPKIWLKILSSYFTFLCKLIMDIFLYISNNFLL